jgi:hypothetical protein
VKEINRGEAVRDRAPGESKKGGVYEGGPWVAYAHRPRGEEGGVCKGDLWVA